MQSGITGMRVVVLLKTEHLLHSTNNVIIASDELRAAFNNLISPSSPDRGILIAIAGSPESLVPGSTVPRSSENFKQNLESLSSLLKEDVASYIVLKQNDEKCVAITYVPDKANVRQKMLFASTRLTLVRELGRQSETYTPFRGVLCLTVNRD